MSKEQQARRGRRAALALAALALVGFALARTGRSGVSAVLHDVTGHALAEAAAGPVPERAVACVEDLHLRPGQTVETALEEAGVDRRTAATMLHELRDLVDLRRVRPRDRFVLYRGRGGSLKRLEYRRRPEERAVVEAVAGDGGRVYRARLEQVPVAVYLRKLAGPVRSSLYDGIRAAGGDPALVVEFADLFSWDFDFFTDTREGDRFSFLVEERVVDGEWVGYGRILAARYRPRAASEPLEAFYYSWDGGNESGYYQANGHSVKKFFLKSPLNYRRISSYFSRRRFHPILKKYRPHLGVDYAAARGTPVVALGNGKVVSVGWRGGFGRTIQIRHSASTLTQYAHLSRYARGIRRGVRVKQGQVIGYVGSSGLATGPHLDFRVRQNGRWINPLSLKGGESEPLPKAQRARFGKEVERLRAYLQRLEAGESIRVTEGDGGLPVLALAPLDTPSAS